MKLRLCKQITEENKHLLVNGDILREELYSLNITFKYIFRKHIDHKWFESEQCWKGTTPSGHIYESSYSDKGIIQNKYNDHKTFYAGNIFHSDWKNPFKYICNLLKNMRPRRNIKW